MGSRLGTVTQGHKVPKSDYRSKWLQGLNRVEMMQNVEVQQTLRSMMSILKDGDELMQDADSAYEFAERRRIQKCHDTVCRIRAESELSKNSSNLPKTKGQDDFEIKLSCEGAGTVRSNSKPKINLPAMSLEGNVKISKKFTNSTKNCQQGNWNDIYEKITQKSEENTHYNNNKLSSSQGDNQDERKEFLPPILEASQEKQYITSYREAKKQHPHSLPTLDTESKFSIIKRTRELRNERDMQDRDQNLSLMTSQIQKKYSKARKISRKIEIFGDNRKLLTEESKIDNENKPTILPLLDSKSFSEIDCNDFLNIKNRLDGLSPAPAVLDHKLHWPKRARDAL